MTYRKKAARAATPANARLPLIVEAAPVNLGELMMVGVVVFFGETGLPVPVPVGTGARWLERVVGQALMVMVTTDGTTGAEEMAAAALEAASLETAAAVLFA
jgi:hypothetical protein